MPLADKHVLCAKLLQSCPTLCNPWTVACQAPPSIGFSRQEYWSGLPCPPPWDLPEPGIKPMFLMSPALAGGFFTSTTARFQLKSIVNVLAQSALTKIKWKIQAKTCQLFNKTNLLLLLSHFSRVRLCTTPQTAAHQAPPSLGFSRQEHWSGLPFPSPMHESEK